MSTTKTRIEKGKKLENYICERIKKKGIDPRADRSHGSGNTNREKADIWTSATIFGRNLGIEAKNHKIPHIKDWWKQAQKLEVLGREPVLAYKLANEPYEETKVVIYLDTLLDLIAFHLNNIERNVDLTPPTDYKKVEALNKVKFGAKMIKDYIDKIN